MERRYQVFISSTFTDLQDERRAITEGLLKIDCLPAGMELFPASDDDQWTLIKGVIDQCDYYLIVSAGRYGSIDTEGISYTEKEYDYAIKQGIPVIGFLRADPGKLTRDQLELEEGAPEKLAAFQEKIKTKTVDFYETPADLQAKVIVGVMKLQKSKPRPGWVRATEAMTDEIRAELEELRRERVERENQELRSELKGSTPLVSSLQQGDDEVTINYIYIYSDASIAEARTVDRSLVSTWDQIFKAIAPYMIDEELESNIRAALNRLLFNIDPPRAHGLFATHNFLVSDETWSLIKVQLRALHAIQISKSDQSGAIGGESRWKLTPAGDDHLTALLALKREE